MTSGRQVYHGHCLHCRSACATVAVVEDGTLVSVGPDREHPNGGICVVGTSAPQLVYHPDRLTQPMRRTRPKTAADPGWEPISWEEALSETAGRLQAIKNQYGPEAVAFGRGTPSATGAMDYFMWVERLAYAFGSPNVLGNTYLCQWARDTCSAYTYGGGFPWPDYENARLIVMLGHNPSISWQNNWRRIRAAQRRGAKLMVVDPRVSESARQADLHLPVRPGTDGALCLGLTRELIVRGAYDAAFLRDWSNAPFLVGKDGRLLQSTAADGGPNVYGAVNQDGELIWLDSRRDPGGQGRPLLDAEYIAPDGRRYETAFRLLRKQTALYTPERVAEITGIAAADFLRAADLWTQIRPIAYFTWNGLEQHTNNMQTNRALCTLYTLTGCLERPGGLITPGRPPKVAIAPVSMLPPGGLERRLGYDRRPLGTAAVEAPSYLAYGAMLTGEPYPVRGLVCFGHNLITQQMDSERGRAALESLDFHVHMELFETPTARLADIILPAASAWECPGLRVGFSSTGPESERWLQWRPAVAAAPGSARPDMDVIFDLAVRLGHGEHFFGGDVTAAWRFLLQNTGVALETVQNTERGLEYPVSTRSQRYAEVDPDTGLVAGFPTPTRRAEIYVERFVEHGVPPLPTYRPPLVGDGVMGPSGPDLPADISVEYPLVLTTTRHRNFSNSQGRAIPNLRRQVRGPSLRIHPDTAGQLGIVDGGRVRVESPVGAVELPAKLAANLPPYLVETEPGWWQGCSPLGIDAIDPYRPESGNLGLLVTSKWADPESGSVSGKAIPCRVRPVAAADTVTLS